jgi:hypothetical protein
MQTGNQQWIILTACAKITVKMPTLLSKVEKFKAWANSYPHCYGEWECDYQGWRPLYAAFQSFIRAKDFVTWSTEELSDVLYAIARDNEIEDLAREVTRFDTALLLDLTEAAIKIGERDAKWQLATQLGIAEANNSRSEELLLILAQDQDEYVRRRSLQALTLIGSSSAERLALEAWSRPDEAQQWARMTTLWVLHHIGSRQLEQFLQEAERDPSFSYLIEYAEKIRSGIY